MPPSWGDEPTEVVCPPPSDMVQVFGNITELREIGKSPHHQHRGIMTQSAEHRFELGARPLVGVAPEADCGEANALNYVEGLVTLLFAQRVAEETTEETNVLFERKVFIANLIEIVVGIHNSSETLDFLRCLPTAALSHD